MKGGIKAGGRSGGFAKTWWGKRWIQVLESFRIGARLSRGRSYARKGQVLCVDIKEGLIEAKVQGSRTVPYEVRIAFETWSEKTCEQVIQIISSKAIITAGLLSGELPQELEQALEKEGIRLFPAAYKDMQTHCSCPDWSNPCKHIAAVAYLLAVELDRDPFLILKLRGLSRATILQRLKEKGQSDQKGIEGDGSEYGHREPEGLLEAQRIQLLRRFINKDVPNRPSPKEFWRYEDVPDELLGGIKRPPVPAFVIKRLGRPPLWRSELDFEKVMEDLYTTLSDFAEKWLSDTEES